MISKRNLIVFFLHAFVPILHATQLVTGNGMAPLSFTQTVTAKVYDIATGTLYLGLQAGAADFALSKAKRTRGSVIPTFSAIGSFVSGQEIEFLTLATQKGSKDALLALVTVPNSSSFEQTSVIVATNNGATSVTSDALNDATPAPDTATTRGIVAIAASNDYVFAAVRPSLNSSEPGNFGTIEGPNQISSGIALIGITRTPSLTLQVKDAITGINGNLATPFNASSTFIRGAGGDVTFASGNLNNNRVEMFWDDQLQRFYVAIRIITGAAATDEGRSIVMGRVNGATNNSITLSQIAPSTAITPGANELVIAAGTNVSLTAKKIQVMHTSTGPSYLIVNGGRDTPENVTNLVFALPLVDVGSPTTPYQGTLANKNVYNATTKRFEEIADNINELAIDTDIFAQVGGGPLPIQTGNAISHMLVFGDTVFVSLNEIQSATVETGLYYSQAMFRPDGRILGWTPWTKRAFPFFAFPSQIPQAAIKFFAVDAVTGDVWGISGNATINSVTSNAVHITTWDQGQGSGSLVTELNNLMPCGSTAVLDLDQSTRGFVGYTINRYALFGGPQQVVMARVSQALGSDLTSAQTVIDDFTSATNLRNTFLPKCAGSVRVLEYSRQVTGNNNFFFAGTDCGLFVFAGLNGVGFDVNTMGSLNLPPFTGGWQKVTSIPGSVIDIKTTGNSLYVLTKQTSCVNPLMSVLYRIDFASNVSTMFATSNIVTIATAATGSLSSTLFFSAIQIITTADDGTTEQLVLATNNGLYRSSRNGGVQAATSQADAGWVLVTPTDLAMFNGISGISNASTYVIPGDTDSISPPSTVWPYSIRDQGCCCSFDRGSIHQVSGFEDIGPFNFCPEFFNSIESDNPTFALLDKITHFWTDGARRLFIVLPPCECCCFNKLLVLPFDTLEWCVSDPSMLILTDPILKATNFFNWIQLIGVTGILMAGTNSGIVALE